MAAVALLFARTSAGSLAALTVAVLLSVPQSPESVSPVTWTVTLPPAAKSAGPKVNVRVPPGPTMMLKPGSLAPPSMTQGMPGGSGSFRTTP